MYLRYVWWRYLTYSLPNIRLRQGRLRGLFTWARSTGLARFPKSRFFQPGSRKRAGNFALWTLQPSNRDKSWEWILVFQNPGGIVLHCLLYIHIISIPFNCSDTALRVAESIIAEKVIIFAFRQVWFVSWIWVQNSSPGSVVFSHPIYTQIWTHGLLFPVAKWSRLSLKKN